MEAIRSANIDAINQAESGYNVVIICTGNEKQVRLSALPAPPHEAASRLTAASLLPYRPSTGSSGWSPSKVCLSGGAPAARSALRD